MLVGVLDNEKLVCLKKLCKPVFVLLVNYQSQIGTPVFQKRHQFLSITLKSTLLLTHSDSIGIIGD